MERKKAVYRGLINTPVYIEDTSATSPEYFQISEFPGRLTAGKNLIKLRGNQLNLETGTSVNIEVLDYNKNPIYNQVIDYLDEDKSRVIAIYVYEETSPGDATITITGVAKNVPIEWQRKTNIKWTRTIAVNPTVVNTSEIIFESDPTITVTEQVAVQLNRVYDTTQFPQLVGSGTKKVKLLTNNKQPVALLTDTKFSQDMVGGTLTVSTPINPQPTALYTPSNTSYTTTIKKILSETSALLDDQFIVYSSQSLTPHIYTTFDDSNFTIDYEATPTYVVTENSESVAILEIKDLEPATGDISRIKVYTSGKGTVGTWELANDIELDETEIFVQGTSSVFPDISIGSFVTQSVIDTYWEPHTYIGKTETTAPTLTWDTASLSNAMDIIQVVDITAKNAVNVVQVTSSFAGNFVKDSQYKITIDALATRSATSSNRNPHLLLYMSGSAFNYDTTDYYNQELPVNLGKRIGRLEINSSNQRIDDYVFNFTADKTGTAVLIFVIDAGEWLLSDIRTTTDNDPGYTPNYTRIRTEIPTKHKSANQLAFKIEYYNQAGVRSKTINNLYNKNWQGGNRYIDGDFSMLTGSLYVADSLNSGVAISGLANTGFVRSLGYDGFETGNPGFLLWSGSALPGQNTKGGVPYSGVGLELYLDTSSYFRYSTADDELYVATKNFFLGDPDSIYISGSGGNLEISSSGFFLNSAGDVTASSFVSIGPNGDTLFDSNSEFVDGVNVGRLVYFDRTEYSHTGNLTSSPQTASIFETFILPGETNLQASLMYEFENNSGTANGALQAQWYIQSASVTASVGTTTGYDEWSSPTALSPGAVPITSINSATLGSIEGGSISKNISSGDVFGDHQGYYVRIYMIAQRTTAGNASDVLKLKGFVYRTSRTVGSSVGPKDNPIR
jgi:hypothetical protein